jgi:hypothetical protein
MVSSIESAITSRETSDDFMPWWPMAMPSVTVMVQNSRGVPPASLTPRWRTAPAASGRYCKAGSFQHDTTPTKGRWISSSVSPMA